MKRSKEEKKKEGERKRTIKKDDQKISLCAYLYQHWLQQSSDQAY